MVKYAKKNKNSKSFVLITKGIKLFVIFAILCLMCYTILRFFIVKNLKEKFKIRELTNQIGLVQNETREIDRKVSLLKNYIHVWEKEITENQKVRNGIDMESIRNIIENIANKHSIGNLNISFSMPMQINEVKGNPVDVLNTEITINFNCLTEYSVYYFLNELQNNKDAFSIIEEVEIRKTKNIDKELIKTLIENGTANLLSVMIKLQWYELSGAAL